MTTVWRGTDLLGHRSVRKVTKRKRTVPEAYRKLCAAREEIAAHKAKIQRLEAKVANLTDPYHVHKARVESEAQAEIKTQLAERGTDYDFVKSIWNTPPWRYNRHKLLLQDYVATQIKLERELVKEGDILMAEAGALNASLETEATDQLPKKAELKWKQGFTLKEHTEWIAEYGLKFAIYEDGSVGDSWVETDDEDETDETGVEDETDEAGVKDETGDD